MIGHHTSSIKTGIGPNTCPCPGTSFTPASMRRGLQGSVAYGLREDGGGDGEAHRVFLSKGEQRDDAAVVAVQGDERVQRRVSPSTRLLSGVEDTVGPGPLLGRQLTTGAGESVAERGAPSRYVVKADADRILN